MLWCGFLMVQLLPYYWVIYVTFVIVKRDQVRADQIYSCSVRDVHTRRSYRYLATGENTLSWSWEWNCPFFWEEHEMWLLYWAAAHACRVCVRFSCGYMAMHVVMWSVGCMWKILSVKVACGLSLSPCVCSSTVGSLLVALACRDAWMKARGLYANDHTRAEIL